MKRAFLDSMRPQKIHDEVAQPEDYTELVKLCWSANGALVKVCCSLRHKSADKGLLLESFLSVLDTGGRALDVVLSCITDAVQETEDKGTLLRSNECGLMCKYAQLVGHGFIVDTLGELINLLRGAPDNVEVDPRRINNGTAVDNLATAVDNRPNLEYWCERFAEAIVEAEPRLPSEYRKMCAHIKREVKKQFPGAEYYKSIGGFLFLRLFCPAIQMPHVYGIVEESQMTPEFGRRLLLVAKTLQTLANGQTFGRKEDYMTGMNNFLEDHDSYVKEFFDHVSDVEVDKPFNGEFIPFTLQGCDRRSLSTIHTFVRENEQEIVKRLKERKQEAVAQIVQSLLRELKDPAPMLDVKRERQEISELRKLADAREQVLNDYVTSPLARRGRAGGEGEHRPGRSTARAGV